MADQSGTSNLLRFFVNGKKVERDDVDPELTLLQFLRTKLRLCGTKLGCGEGGCGACTVMISQYSHEEQKVRHHAINACLVPICAVDGCAVVTVEGIGSTKTRLHAVQERISKCHGSQCGFCTPGIVMSMYTLLRNNPQPSQAEMESAFEGNLCRCTGYRPILEGFKSLTKEFCCSGPGPGGQCCMTMKDKDGVEVSSTLYDVSKFTPYDPSQEPIFPPELMTADWSKERPFLVVKGERVTWYRPTSLKELLALKHGFPRAKIVVGNTEVGVEVKFRNLVYPVLISPSEINELHTIQSSETELTVGAAVTLTEFGHAMEELIKTLPEHKSRVLLAFVDMLRWFAGHQIRNVAAIGGNIMTASPISDLNPLLVAAKSQLTFVSFNGGTRTIPFTTDFFTGYRKVAVGEAEVLQSVTIPFTGPNEYFYGFKQAKRREDDIAIVNAGMRVRLSETENNTTRTVEDCSLAFGGMAAVIVTAKQTEQMLIGKEWTKDLFSEASKTLIDDLPLDSSAPGGKIEYRRSLTISFFFKFLLSVLNCVGTVEPEDLSAFQRTEPGSSKSVQVFQEVPSDQSADDTIGRPLAHVRAEHQATGEAVYIDDMPSLEDQRYIGFVCSSKAHAIIKSVDASSALAMEGVSHFISVKDVPGSNEIGVLVPDETVFADGKVYCIGHVIGVVLATTQKLAREAAAAVRVEYEELEPIITIEQAIKAESFIGDPMSFGKGDCESAFSSSDFVKEGEMRIGGQEHFYLETQASLAVPGEEDEMTLYTSTQNPSLSQTAAATALGVPSNRVVCKVKRMGGGFGGKETRASMLSAAAVVAARVSGHPTRFMLDRDEDMAITGQKHPFLAKFKVGFNKDGKVTALDIKLYSNGGWSLDLSGTVMTKAAGRIDHCYYWPTLAVTGWVCRTHLPSNTAFRGFGATQGNMYTESIITDVAGWCSLPAEEVREKNMYRTGDQTFYLQKLENVTLLRCWKEVIDRANLDKLKSDAAQFNKTNRWKKRGVAVIPTKFAIGFGQAGFMHQAGAFIVVYVDGSVLLTHGGTEMGQGLHTKMIQICSRVLAIPTSKIFLSETSTDTVPNTSPTAASLSTDLNGGAVKNAAEKIRDRLEPFKTKNPDGSWEDWVQAAYQDKVPLSATGFYGSPLEILENGKIAFLYFCYGAACAQVEIDTLTGDSQVLKTEIVMDVGNSLNPAIDIGQIEGAFVQGMGYFTMEESVVSPNGFLFSRGPGTYKIPGFADIPKEFNVALLRSAPNERAVYSSKAIGEPPLFLASSVFYAIKDAISAARSDAGLTGVFRLDSPATVERIRMACVDHVTKQVPPVDPTATPWAIMP
ncbi:xanthine dehydrogenase/oxidase-like [Sycon ciliatum]|uniref:xanthine dehydrogenase/oxidase-like n=1 Tax=Sycon ciliatum TaxID=27933 RepID=UPI0031F5F07F